MILKRKTMLQKNKTKKTPFILTFRLLYFLEHFTPYLFWPPHQFIRHLLQSDFSLQN